MKDHIGDHVGGSFNSIHGSFQHIQSTDVTYHFGVGSNLAEDASLDHHSDKKFGEKASLIDPKRNEWFMQQQKQMEEKQKHWETTKDQEIERRQILEERKLLEE